jgi:twitching motility two-component system response regulator PilH
MLKVLIIDDSNVERHLLKKMLNELNFASIIEATNGEEGVKIAEENKPDLILMDVIMPGINGFQATKKIISNQALKNVPIIICSSKDQEIDKMWGVKQGARAYIIKPVNKNILFEEINKLLG